jgi:hypothetical protein
LDFGLAGVAMNIFTRFLSGGLGDKKLEEWIRHWDGVEGLVVRVFKAKGATAEDEGEYGRLRPWLLAHYPAWEGALRPHWQAAKVAGALAKQDPFARLLRVETAGGFVGDWEAMQHLPAAREALNRLVVERTGAKE